MTRIGENILAVDLRMAGDDLSSAYGYARESLAAYPHMVTAANHGVQIEYGLPPRVAARVVGEAAMELFSRQLDAVMVPQDMPPRADRIF